MKNLLCQQCMHGSVSQTCMYRVAGTTRGPHRPKYEITNSHNTCLSPATSAEDGSEVPTSNHSRTRIWRITCTGALQPTNGRPSAGAAFSAETARPPATRSSEMASTRSRQAKCQKTFFPLSVAYHQRYVGVMGGRLWRAKGLALWLAQVRCATAACVRGLL